MLCGGCWLNSSLQYFSRWCGLCDVMITKKHRRELLRKVNEHVSFLLLFLSRSSDYYYSLEKKWVLVACLLRLLSCWLNQWNREYYGGRRSRKRMSRCIPTSTVIISHDVDPAWWEIVRSQWWRSNAKAMEVRIDVWMMWSALNFFMLYQWGKVIRRRRSNNIIGKHHLRPYHHHHTLWCPLSLFSLLGGLNTSQKVDEAKTSPSTKRVLGG